jgi:hypothetical protein
MEYDRNMIGTYVSPGTKEGKTGITHFLIQAKQTILFNEEESEKVRNDIFTIMKDFNCLIFTNFQGIEIFEEEIIESDSYHDPKIEEIRKELGERVIQTTIKAYGQLSKLLEENK